MVVEDDAVLDFRILDTILSYVIYMPQFNRDIPEKFSNNPNNLLLWNLLKHQQILLQSCKTL